MNTFEYRNLTEQVLKNKEDILHHFQRDEVLADFGIHIIGQVVSPEELPASAANYGDAYAVGTQSPFNYYIWTRANNLSPVDYWFNFGEIAIAGPQGPVGPQGIPGKDGKTTTWYYFTGDSLPSGTNNGDLAMNDNGDIYRLLTAPNGWAYVMNIKGPTGPQGQKGEQGPRGIQGPAGPKGEQGDVGGFINIAGIISGEDLLPDPDLINNLTVAYLVGGDAPYNLYIQVGSGSATAQWFNAGPLNVATMVTSAGVFLNTWDADTKVNKIYDQGLTRVYGITPEGLQTVYNISYTPNEGYLAQYGTQGRLYTNSPTEAGHCANKAYVDSKVGTGSSGGSRWVIFGPTQASWPIETLNAIKEIHDSVQATGKAPSNIIPVMTNNNYNGSTGSAKLLLPVYNYQVTKQSNGTTFIRLDAFANGMNNNYYYWQIYTNTDGSVKSATRTVGNFWNEILPYEIKNPLAVKYITEMPTSTGTVSSEEYGQCITMLDDLRSFKTDMGGQSTAGRFGMYVYNGSLFTTQIFTPGTEDGYEEKITVGYYDPIIRSSYYWKFNHTWGTYTLEAFQGPPTVLFYINDVDYNALEGQTWGEWINSSYNTLGLTAGTQLGDDPTHIYYAGYTPLTLYGSQVSVTDTIYDGSYYST